MTTHLSTINLPVYTVCCRDDPSVRNQPTRLHSVLPLRPICPQSTYPFTQCAAVRTHLSTINLPVYTVCCRYDPSVRNQPTRLHSVLPLRPICPQSTYPFTQCAAVTTHLSAINLPVCTVCCRYDSSVRNQPTRLHSVLP